MNSVPEAISRSSNTKHIGDRKRQDLPQLSDPRRMQAGVCTRGILRGKITKWIREKTGT